LWAYLQWTHRRSKLPGRGSGYPICCSWARRSVRGQLIRVVLATQCFRFKDASICRFRTALVGLQEVLGGAHHVLVGDRLLQSLVVDRSWGLRQFRALGSAMGLGGRQSIAEWVDCRMLESDVKAAWGVDIHALGCREDGLLHNGIVVCC
jgi:hypothetical protein